MTSLPVFGIQPHYDTDLEKGYQITLTYKHFKLLIYKAFSVPVADPDTDILYPEFYMQNYQLAVSNDYYFGITDAGLILFNR